MDEARMYPSMAKPAASPQEPAKAETKPQPEADKVQPAPQPEQSEEDEPETLAERMYADDGTPPEDGNYQPAIGNAFDDLERRERERGDEEGMANIEAIREGRQQVQDTLQEFGVGAPGAKELSGSFARYRENPLSDDALEAQNSRCMAELSEAWGKNLDKNLAFARLAFEQAKERVPWLATEVESGAGSDARVVKQFAAIGRRLAKRAKG